MVKRQRDPSVTSRIMSAIKSKDSKAEVLLRHRLWKEGFRYRKHDKRLPGKPDLVFPGAKLIVFVDGDFWHGNAWRLRGLPSLEALFPTRTEWWVNKIQRNMNRDRESDALLTAAGWHVIRVWESDVLKDPAAILSQIATQLRQR